VWKCGSENEIIRGKQIRNLQSVIRNPLQLEQTIRLYYSRHGLRRSQPGNGVKKEGIIGG
jgi:hypothetical protein